jgi:hypothetical protein
MEHSVIVVASGRPSVLTREEDDEEEEEELSVDPKRGKL